MTRKERGEILDALLSVDPAKTWKVAATSLQPNGGIGVVVFDDGSWKRADLQPARPIEMRDAGSALSEPLDALKSDGSAVNLTRARFAAATLLADAGRTVTTRLVEVQGEFRVCWLEPESPKCASSTKTTPESLFTDSTISVLLDDTSRGQVAGTLKAASTPVGPRGAPALSALLLAAVQRAAAQPGAMLGLADILPTGTSPVPVFSAAAKDVLADTDRYCIWQGEAYVADRLVPLRFSSRRVGDDCRASLAAHMSRLRRVNDLGAAIASAGAEPVISVFVHFSASANNVDQSLLMTQRAGGSDTRVQRLRASCEPERASRVFADLLKETSEAAAPFGQGMVRWLRQFADGEVKAPTPLPRPDAVLRCRR